MELSAEAGSLHLKMSGAPVTLARQFCDLLNSDAHVSSLFIACLTRTCAVPLASSCVFATADCREMAIDYKIHMSVYSTSNSSKDLEHAYCKAVSHSIKHLKNKVYKKIYTQIRALVMCLSNSKGLIMNGICKGENKYAAQAQSEILSKLQSRFKLRKVEVDTCVLNKTTGAYDDHTDTYYQLDESNKNRYICLFSYDRDLHDFNQGLMIDFFRKNKVGLECVYNSSVHYPKMNYNVICRKHKE